MYKDSKLRRYIQNNEKQISAEVEGQRDDPHGLEGRLIISKNLLPSFPALLVFTRLTEPRYFCRKHKVHTLW